METTGTFRGRFGGIYWREEEGWVSAFSGFQRFEEFVTFVTAVRTGAHKAQSINNE